MKQRLHDIWKREHEQKLLRILSGYARIFFFFFWFLFIFVRPIWDFVFSMLVCTADLKYCILFPPSFHSSENKCLIDNKNKIG
jgi:hypothetical protein